MVRVRITPINRAKRKNPFGAREKTQLYTGLLAAVTATVNNGKRFAAKYPPQTLTATGYRRTGTLKRSWSAKVQPGLRRIIGVVGSSGNIAPYNFPVQGSAKFGQQNPLFRGAGWQGVDEIVEVMDKEIIQRADRVMDAIVAS